LRTVAEAEEEADEAPWEDTTEEEEEEPLPVESPEEAQLQFEAPVAAPAEELELQPTMPAADLSGISEEVNGFSVEVSAPEEALSEAEIDSKLKEFGEYDPTLDLSSYIP